MVESLLQSGKMAATGGYGGESTGFRPLLQSVNVCCQKWRSERRGRSHAEYPSDRDLHVIQVAISRVYASGKAAFARCRELAASSGEV